MRNRLHLCALEAQDFSCRLGQIQGQISIERFLSFFSPSSQFDPFAHLTDRTTATATNFMSASYRTSQAPLPQEAFTNKGITDPLTLLPQRRTEADNGTRTMLPLPGITRESSALRADDYEAIWQAERASSRQRRHAEAAALNSSTSRQRASTSRAAAPFELQLPTLLLSSSRDSLQAQACALVAELESSMSSFAELEAELQEVRDAKQRRSKSLAKKARSAEGRAIRRSASEQQLFFSQQRRQFEGRIPAPAGERLPPLATSGERGGGGECGRRHDGGEHAGERGAAGSECGGSKSQRFGLRQQRSDRRGFGGRVALRQDESASVQLRRILKKHLLRLIDVFRRWDVDSSGDVDPDEFFEAIWALGYDVSRADSDALFDSLDADGGGTISYRELRNVLQGAQEREQAHNGARRGAQMADKAWPKAPHIGKTTNTRLANG